MMILTLAQSEFSQSLVLTIVGMGVVFVALLILMVMVMALHMLLREHIAPAKPTPVKPQPTENIPEPAATPTTPTRDDELIVVLAAAAAAALGTSADRVRVLRFRRASSHWSAAGRLGLTTSHRPVSRSPRSVRP